jgi:hypothetical protein
MREGKKRFFQKVMRDFKIPELKSVSNYKRNVYYSRLYNESDTYCQNLCNVFKSVAIKERVLSKDGSKVMLHKDKITEELKRKLQIKTKQTLENLTNLHTSSHIFTRHHTSSLVIVDTKDVCL